MEQINSLNQVADFHRTFNAPILDTPQIPSEQRCELRVSLLQEELNELETNTQDVENNSSSDNSKDDKFEENIVSRQEQDLPFYPEPSKNKKKSKK